MRFLDVKFSNIMVNYTSIPDGRLAVIDTKLADTESTYELDRTEYISGVELSNII